jgi:hypothetical protein
MHCFLPISSDNHFALIVLPGGTFRICICAAHVLKLGVHLRHPFPLHKKKREEKKLMKKCASSLQSEGLLNHPLPALAFLSRDRKISIN